MRNNSTQSENQFISGAFQCKSCGATTTIRNEPNPMPFCKYCGAPIPEIKDLVDERFRKIQEQFKSENELESLKMQLKQERIIQSKQASNDIRATKLQHRQDLKTARIAAETERMKIQLDSIERQKEINRKEAKSDFIRVIIMIGIAILCWLIFVKH